jgi:hypothetical protein
MPTDNEILIDRAISRHLEIKRLEQEEAADEAKIVALGAGKHSDATGRVLTVVGSVGGRAGAVSYELPEDGEKRARDLAGNEFPALFDRKVIWTPTEGFHLVAPKLLTPAKARDIVALCYKQGRGSNGTKAYIKWPEAK